MPAAVILALLAQTPKLTCTGWHDEFASLHGWSELAMENKAHHSLVARGSLHLWLGPVPNGWPYEFQWSGLKRDVRVDISRTPVLEASVSGIKGYAHLDVDVLDADGKPVRTFRSSTLNDTEPGRKPSEPVAGVVVADLGKDLLPATYRFQIRLIVGGANTGCTATYHWLRFVAKADTGNHAASQDSPAIRVDDLGIRR